MLKVLVHNSRFRDYQKYLLYLLQLYWIIWPSSGLQVRFRDLLIAAVLDYLAAVIWQLTSKFWSTFFIFRYIYQLSKHKAHPLPELSRHGGHWLLVLFFIFSDNSSLSKPRQLLCLRQVGMEDTGFWSSCHI